VTLGISRGFLVETLLQFGGKIDTGLVGKADKYPKYVGHLFAQIVFFALFEALIALFSRHYTGQFAHFFGKDGHVGKFAEIAYTYGLYPLVYSFLCLFYRHIAEYYLVL